MANDPGLAGDTCIFVEAIAGDGGAHDAGGAWWLSPDVELTGAVSGPGVADGGHVNRGRVTSHRKPAASGCHFPGDESLTVELWVAAPSLVMAPHVPGSAARVGFIGSPVPAEGGQATQPIDFTPTPGLPADAALGPGPKCLVARSYPSSGTPSGTGFFVPGDPHVAQHNLVILPFTAATLVPHGLGTLKVATVNPAVIPSPSPLLLSQVKLRAVLDLAPGQSVRRIVLRRLQLVSGFQRLRTSPLTGGFRFDLSAFEVAGVVDHSHAGPLEPPPHPLTFEARIVLPPRQLVHVTFQANLHGVEIGEACLFHLTQSSLQDVVEGGLTVAMVRL